MLSYAVEVKNLSKTYGQEGKKKPIFALSDLDLRVEQGSFFGLLGPNGAGKSTLINILAGLVNKSSGSVSVKGFDQDSDIRNFKRSIGVVPQETNFDPFLTPYESLDIQAGLYGIKKNDRKINQILKNLGLEDKANAYTRSLSGGMRRRLLIGKALVHNPSVIILDEPTAGVDIELREMLWNYMKELNSQGTTIILTTHYLEEAEKVCDEIAILNNGELVACSKTRELIERVNLKVIHIKYSGVLEKNFLLPKGANIKEHVNKKISLSYNRNTLKTDKLIEFFRSKSLEIIDLSTEEPDLADIFKLLVKSK
jgi:ABC-2 type transport system ATP-binding protein